MCHRSAWRGKCIHTGIRSHGYPFTRVSSTPSSTGCVRLMVGVSCGYRSRDPSHPSRVRTSRCPQILAQSRTPSACRALPGESLGHSGGLLSGCLWPSIAGAADVDGLTVLGVPPYRGTSVSVDGWCRMPVAPRARVSGGSRRSPVWPSLPTCRRPVQPRSFPNSGVSSEQAHLSAEQPSAGQNPRLPAADADPRRPGDPGRPSSQGPLGALGLTSAARPCSPPRTA